MLLNNLKISLRRLLKHKSQSLILISGLTIGMATCILLLQYVSFELSFDNFHSKQDLIYRVINERMQNGNTVQKGPITYPTISPTMKEEFPEIRNATRMTYSTDIMITKGEQVSPVEPGFWVDEHFFEVFDFELLAGDRMSLLDAPNEIVLPKPIADRYFPAAKDDYNAIIGETLIIDRYTDPFKVVGVLAEIPANSNLDFGLLLSYSSFIKYAGEAADNSWTWSDFYHYLELEPGTDVAALEAKFADFSDRHFRGAEVSGSNEKFTLQAMSDIHLNSQDLEYEIAQTANGRAVWSLLIIAFFILFIAWINYVNLSSVRAIERSKEVGVRKVVGANRSQLMMQFFSEALMINLVSLVLALGIVEITIPLFASVFGLNPDTLSLFEGAYFNSYLFFGLLTLIIGGVIVSGAYPAFLLSSASMVSVLKGVFAKNVGGANLRKGLVVFQFAISIGLIIGAWLVARQINYMHKQDLGINIDQVMIVNSPEMTTADSSFFDKLNTFKSTLVNIPGIESATTSNRSPGDRMGRTFNIRRVGVGPEGPSFTSNVMAADFHFAETYGLENLAGRFFRFEDHNLDGNQVNKIVLNEKAAKMVGFTNYEDAVGSSLNIYERNWEIVGVVKDYHQRSLHHAIEPIILMPYFGTYNQVSIKISTSDLEPLVTKIKTTYADFFPGNTFLYNFADERFQRLYEADVRFGNILSFFTLLTILIACLGLFGLASYTTFLRTKEIGIRKVLGASILGIMVLLSKDFLKLVLVSIFIAAPLAYFVLNQWLDDFAYRIDVPWWVFLIAGLIAIAVAILTISFQSLRAAIANPSNSLKSE